MAAGSFSGRKALLARIARALARVDPIGPKDVAAAVAACRELARHGVGATVGKFSGALDDPETVVRDYLFASNALHDVGPGHFYLSVKPPALHFDLDRAVRIASTARANGHGVHFDSHGRDAADPTRDLLDRLIDTFGSAEGPRPGFSITLPSRWKRSLADADWAIERGLAVRLVKGEFRASDELDPERGMLALVDRLVTRVPTLVLGTHDPRLARRVLERCRDLGAPVQLELLFGFPSAAMIRLAREHGAPFGFYVPYGDALLLYGIRHLLLNPHKLTRGNYLAAFRGVDSRVNEISRRRYCAPT
jgi:proline dehydrogenase